MERNYSIGSAQDNHLVLDSPTLDAHHARLVRDSETIVIRDLGSVEGTWVNGQRITTKQITCGDTIRLGDVEFEIIDPLLDTASFEGGYWSLIGDSSWLAGQEFPLIFDDDRPILLGRGKHCDIVFPGTHLSREHASIRREGDYLRLEDLKSANATFVNDERISSAKLIPGDRVRLDVYSFRVFGPGISLHKSATQQADALEEPVETETEKLKPATKTGKQRPRQWKTRPTSPGNRPAPEARPTTTRRTWLLALLLLTLLVSVTLRVVVGGFVF